MENTSYILNTNLKLFLVLRFHNYFPIFFQTSSIQFNSIQFYLNIGKIQQEYIQQCTKYPRHTKKTDIKHYN